MQSICLLFAGRGGLDDTNNRQSILRIPEVSRKIKEAQRLLDQTLDPSVHIDLFAFLNAPDNEFNSNTSLKSLVAATVQVGLFERLVKYRNRPEFLIGRNNGCSAMMVCADLQSFEDFVLTSKYCKENTLMARFTQQNSPLTGMEMEEFGSLQWNPDGYYEKKEVEKKQAAEILEEISTDHLIAQCIHVGPSTESMERAIQNQGLYNIASMNSIEIDPILNTFWKAS